MSDISKLNIEEYNDKIDFYISHLKSCKLDEENINIESLCKARSNINYLEDICDKLLENLDRVYCIYTTDLQLKAEKKLHE